MRNEGIRIDDALDEVFRIAREADIPAEISHLKLAGRASWGRMPRVLARIDFGAGGGARRDADQYPFIAGATSLDATIPTWAESGGWDSLLVRLRDPATRARIQAEMSTPPTGRRGSTTRPAGAAAS